MIMATINDKLTYLAGTKDAIKQAIINKGVTVEDNATFRSYADKIATIQGGGGETAKIDIANISFAYSDFTEFDPTPFDFANKTDCDYMFYLCRNLTTVGLFDTSKVRFMSDMFSSCSSLQTIPLFDTSNVINMYDMFYGCSSLQTIPSLNTSNVTNMASMFRSCSSLQTIPAIDTSNVTNAWNMFTDCTSLVSVPLLNMPKNRDMTMFNGCSNLTTLGGFTGLQVNFSINQSPLLTTESVMNIINQAQDMSAQPRTLTLHADVFAKLTEEQIATANAKGWNIAS